MPVDREDILGLVLSEVREGRIEVRRLDGRIDSIDLTLQRQADQLAEHIRRTQLLEQRMAPVENHVQGWSFLAKVLGAATLTTGAITGVYAAVKVFVG